MITPSLPFYERQFPVADRKPRIALRNHVLLMAFAFAASGCQNDAGGLSVPAVSPAQAQAPAPRQQARPAASQSQASSSGFTVNNEQLLQAAHQGDKEAAVALYESAIDCVSGDLAKKFLERLSLQPNSWVSSPGKMKDLSPEQLEQVEEQVRLAQDYDANCAGTREMTESGELYEVARMAADAGDRQAGFCYASGRLPRPKAWEQDAAKLAQYRENAARYINQGMQAGDWRAVALALESSGGKYYSWLSLVIGRNPEMAYELTRLQRLGADGPTAADLDKQLAIRARALNPQAITAADRRAETTFQQAFFKAQPYRNVVACPI